MSTESEVLDPVSAAVMYGANASEGEDLDPQSRRQLAVVVLGRRSMATSNAWLLLHDALALATQTLEVSHCGVSLVNPDGQTMTFRYGDQESVRRRIFGSDHHINAQQNQSLSRTTLRAGHPINLPDVPNDPRIKDTVLRQLGVQSAIVCPLIYGTQVFGTIGVYSDTPRQFSKEEELFVETIGHLVTMAIVRQRNEERARVIDDIPGLYVVRLQANGQIHSVNRSCQDASGFTSSEVKSRLFAGTFLPPEDTNQVQKAVEKAVRDIGPVTCESGMLTKQSERHRVQWTFQSLRRVDGVVESVLCLGKSASEKKIDKPQPDGAVLERRRQPRRRYPYKQKIAPITSGKLPTMEHFYSTACYDVSASGFSFLAPIVPEYRELVVALGSHPSLIYVKAEVRHSTPTFENGEQMFLIGCQYVGRADYTASEAG